MTRRSRHVRRGARALAAAGLGAVVLVVLAPAAGAHPLGNFSVNTSTGVRLTPERLVVDHVVDSAEIPTVQQRGELDADGDGAISDPEARAAAVRRCRGATDDVVVTIGGRAVALDVDRSALTFPPGEAGLDTTRLECRLSASIAVTGALPVTVVDRSGSGRVGWHEVTAVGDGVTLTGSKVPTASTSAVLTAYPKDRLASPLAVDRACFRVSPGGSRLSAAQQATIDRTASSAGHISTLPGVDGATRSIGNLVASQQFTLGLAIAAVGIAIFLGSMHALAPGHGKTVMAAYLVGQRGTTRQAFGLCAAVTLTHTAGVLVLGTILTFSTVVAPERIYPVLGALSGLLVASIGAALLRRSWRARRASRAVWHPTNMRTDPSSEHGSVRMFEHTHVEERVLVGAGVGHSHDHHDHHDDDHERHDHHDHHDHHEHHDHDHDHDHGWHSHGAGSAHQHPEIDPGLGWRSLMGMGFAGGMVPSPSALVVLLGAIALSRTWFGVSLVVAYGVGMALSLVIAGFLLVKVRSRLDGFMSTEHGRRMAWTVTVAPIATACFVIAGGVWIASLALLVG